MYGWFCLLRRNVGGGGRFLGKGSGDWDCFVCCFVCVVLVVCCVCGDFVEVGCVGFVGVGVCWDR